MLNCKNYKTLNFSNKKEKLENSAKRVCRRRNIITKTHLYDYKIPLKITLDKGYLLIE